MDLEKLQQKLLETAREHPVPDHVPYSFAQRIMARLVNPAPVDLAAVWARALWRAAAVCVAISIGLSFWSVSSAEESSVLTLETTVLSVAEQLSDPW